MQWLKSKKVTKSSLETSFPATVQAQRDVCFMFRKIFGWIIALIYLQLVSASAIKPLKTLLIPLQDKHQRRVNELPGGKLMTDHVWTLSAERNLNFKCLFLSSHINTDEQICFPHSESNAVVRAKQRLKTSKITKWKSDATGLVFLFSSFIAEVSCLIFNMLLISLWN